MQRLTIVTKLIDMLLGRQCRQLPVCYSRVTTLSADIADKLYVFLHYYRTGTRCNDEYYLYRLFFAAGRQCLTMWRHPKSEAYDPVCCVL